MASKGVLMVVTSHDRLNDGHPTGLWFEEFATPYRLFNEQGYEVAVASTRGGKVPIDPRSRPDKPGDEERDALETLEHTLPLSEVTPEEYDAVFFPGGHGTMWDLPGNPVVGDLLTSFARSDKVIASVCHGPAAFVGPTLADGRPLVAGRRIAAFTDREEHEARLDRAVPFLLESRLRELGAEVVAGAPWSDTVVVDGKLVTGQNPQSSGHAAREVIRLLGG